MEEHSALGVRISELVYWFPFWSEYICSFDVFVRGL